MLTFISGITAPDPEVHHPHPYTNYLIVYFQSPCAFFIVSLIVVRHLTHLLYIWPNNMLDKNKYCLIIPAGYSQNSWIRFGIHIRGLKAQLERFEKYRRNLGLSIYAQGFSQLSYGPALRPASALETIFHLHTLWTQFNIVISKGVGFLLEILSQDLKKKGLLKVIY